MVLSIISTNCHLVSSYCAVQQAHKKKGTTLCISHARNHLFSSLGCFCVLGLPQTLVPSSLAYGALRLQVCTTQSTCEMLVLHIVLRCGLLFKTYGLKRGDAGRVRNLLNMVELVCRGGGIQAYVSRSRDHTLNSMPCFLFWIKILKSGRRRRRRMKRGFTKSLSKQMEIHFTSSFPSPAAGKVMFIPMWFQMEYFI